MDGFSKRESLSFKLRWRLLLIPTEVRVLNHRDRHRDTVSPSTARPFSGNPTDHQVVHYFPAKMRMWEFQIVARIFLGLANLCLKWCTGWYDLTIFVSHQRRSIHAVLPFNQMHLTMRLLNWQTTSTSDLSTLKVLLMIKISAIIVLSVVNMPRTIW